LNLAESTLLIYLFLIWTVGFNISVNNFYFISTNYLSLTRINPLVCLSFCAISLCWRQINRDICTWKLQFFFFFGCRKSFKNKLYNKPIHQLLLLVKTNEKKIIRGITQLIRPYVRFLEVTSPSFINLRTTRCLHGH
jgi:hypothetical protein